MHGRLPAVAVPIAIAIAMLALAAAPAGAVPTSECSRTEPDTTTACPRIISGTAEVARRLGASTGRWRTSAPPTSLAAQWQACTSASPGSCANIPGETDLGHLVSPADLGLRLRLVITATDAAPGSDHRASQLTNVVIANSGDFPGKSLVFPPTVDVLAPGIASAPRVGDTLHVPDGSGPVPASDGWFNPPAAEIAYRWRRCDAGGTLASCMTIPGQSSRDYVLAAEDVGHALRARVVGTNPEGAQALLSTATATVAPVPVVPGVPGAGGAGGLLVSTPPLDLLPPVLDSLSLAPAAFRAGRAAGRGTTVSFGLSEPATLTLSVKRVLAGVRRGGSCAKPPRPAPANSAGCTLLVAVEGTIAHAGTSGPNRLRFAGRLGGRALASGAYRLLAAATDNAGNLSTTLARGFRILATAGK